MCDQSGDMTDRDLSALLKSGGCACCGATLPHDQTAHGAFLSKHATHHLAKGEAVVIIKGGKQCVVPTYQVDPEPSDADGQERERKKLQARARKQAAGDYAKPHRGVKLPKGRKEWKP